MSKDSYSLRPAVKDDLPQIVELEQTISKLPWSLEHFLAELDKPFSSFLVLSDDETDTQIAGFIVFWNLSSYGTIIHFGVGLPFRGLGFGKKMIHKMIQIACHAGLSEIFLEVRSTNTAAIDLYQKFGFSIQSMIRNFYSNGDDAYKMSWSLSQKDGEL